MGEYISTDNAVQIIQNMNNERTETALSTICDDLSFSMYVEESIVETIRKLEEKKIKAVNGMCFLSKFTFTLNFMHFLYCSQNKNIKEENINDSY